MSNIIVTVRPGVMCFTKYVLWTYDEKMHIEMSVQWFFKSTIEGRQRGHISNLVRLQIYLHQWECGYCILLLHGLLTASMTETTCSTSVCSSCAQ